MGRVAMEFKPKARTSGVIVRELDDELLLFDRDQDKAFCLKSIAGQVWKLSDGRTSIAYMIRLIRNHTDVQVSESAVYTAIKQLDQDGLLDKSASLPAKAISRRDMMQRTGVAAALAIPMITAISLPTAGFASGSAVCTSPCLGNSEHCGCCVNVNGTPSCGVCSSCLSGADGCCQVNSVSTEIKCCPSAPGVGNVMCRPYC